MGLISVKSARTGFPSTAPKSIGCSRKQSEIAGAETWSTRGFRTWGIAIPSPIPVDPSVSRASSTWSRNSRSISAGRRSTSTIARSAVCLSAPFTPWKTPPAWRATASVGSDPPFSSGTANVSGEIRIPRAVAHSSSSARLKRCWPWTSCTGISSRSIQR